MFLTFWLDQPTWLNFGLLALLFLSWCIGIVAISRAKRCRPVILSVGMGITPAFLGVIAVLLSLLVGFVANDAWERQRQAARVVQSECGHAIAVYNLSRTLDREVPDTRALLSDYIEALVVEEWPAMERSGFGSPKAGSALGRLLEAVASPQFDTVVGRATHSALLSAVLSLQASRSERLALSDFEGDDSKWATLLVLALLTLLTIGLIHSERPWSQVVTLAIFGTAMTVTFGVIATHERPFDGPFAIGPKPILQVQNLIAVPG